GLLMGQPAICAAAGGACAASTAMARNDSHDQTWRVLTSLRRCRSTCTSQETKCFAQSGADHSDILHCRHRVAVDLRGEARHGYRFLVREHGLELLQCRSGSLTSTPSD